MEWVFAYGSLIWRPGFEYVDRQRATAQGWTRRFWQGSPDHRGTPSAPGRVVTLIPRVAETCMGIAYRVDTCHTDPVLRYLDERESGGYERVMIDISIENKGQTQALTYIATPNNVNYLGQATLDEMAAHIAGASGPSGSNRAYLHELNQALKRLSIRDDHVSELANRTPLDP